MNLISSFRRAAACAIAVFAALAPSTALAQGAASFPRVSVGGQIFADYAAPLAGPQAFHLTRAFVTTRAQLNEQFSGLIQLNPSVLAYTNAGGARASEPENVIVQMAYVQADNLLPGVTMQFGQLFVPWTEYAYRYFPYRMLATLPIEGGLANTLGLGNTGYLSAWDRGLKLKGSLGPLAINAAVLNGEGLRGSEGDGQRSYQAILTYPLLPSLDVTVMGHRGNPTGAQQADRWGGSVVYHSPELCLGAESSGLVDVAASGAATFRQIHSAFGVLALPTPWAMPTKLIARETVSTAQGGAAGTQLESLVGIGLQPTEGLVVVLDDQLVNPLGGAPGPSAHVIALRTSMAF